MSRRHIRIFRASSALALTLAVGITAKVAEAGGPISVSVANAATAPSAPAMLEAASELPVHNQFDLTMYGFVEGDSIWDSTQSFNDLAGNANISRTGSYGAGHDRFQEGARNSRIGFRLRAPDALGGRIKTTALLEMDFLGNQPPLYSAVSEGGFYTNPTFRIRHMLLNVETPWGTFLFGQYWQLFGWQSTFQPCTVQIQGIADELYARTPQIRWTDKLDAGPIRIEGSLALTRPVERDSGTPDGQAGLKLSLPGWQGYTTIGQTGSGLQAGALAVTALGRRFVVPALAAMPQSSVDLTAAALAFDVLVPIIPASKTSHANALTLTGEFSRGTGDADMFTNLSLGSYFPAPATGTYPQAMDNGLVTFDATGKAHTIDVESGLVGLQYYFPNGGEEFLAVNYGFLRSGNLGTLGLDPKKTWNDSRFFDASLFWDPLRGVRFGLEYARFAQTYLDGNAPVDNRVQFSAFLIF